MGFIFIANFVHSAPDPTTIFSSDRNPPICIASSISEEIIRQTPRLFLDSTSTSSNISNTRVKNYFER